MAGAEKSTLIQRNSNRIRYLVCDAIVRTRAVLEVLSQEQREQFFRGGPPLDPVCTTWTLAHHAMTLVYSPLESGPSRLCVKRIVDMTEALDRMGFMIANCGSMVGMIEISSHGKCLLDSHNARLAPKSDCDSVGTVLYKVLAAVTPHLRSDFSNDPDHIDYRDGVC